MLIYRSGQEGERELVHIYILCTRRSISDVHFVDHLLNFVVLRQTMVITSAEAWWRSLSVSKCSQILWTQRTSLTPDEFSLTSKWLGKDIGDKKKFLTIRLYPLNHSQLQTLTSDLPMKCRKREKRFTVHINIYYLWICFWVSCLCFSFRF